MSPYNRALATRHQQFHDCEVALFKHLSGRAMIFRLSEFFLRKRLVVLGTEVMMKNQALEDWVRIKAWVIFHKNDEASVKELRLQATRIIARERRVTPQTVYRNIKLAMKIDKSGTAEDIDMRLEYIRWYKSIEKIIP